jgi:hypothetical protein
MFLFRCAMGTKPRRCARWAFPALNGAHSLEVSPMNRESAFTMDTSSIKYGPGATREICHDVSRGGRGI